MNKIVYSIFIVLLMMSCAVHHPSDVKPSYGSPDTDCWEPLNPIKIIKTLVNDQPETDQWNREYYDLGEKTIEHRLIVEKQKDFVPSSNITPLDVLLNTRML